MKIIKIVSILGILIPCATFAVGKADFENAAKLLSAARRGDIQTVQVLINSGTDVNYVDATGLSLVCTAVMNNDTQAIQILQMYGADASNCERQIKKYKQKTSVAANGEEYGFFSGLSSSHVLALSAIGVAGVVGGVVLLGRVFDNKNNNGGSGGGGSRPGGGGGSGGAVANLGFNVPYGPAYLTDDGTIDTSYDLSSSLSVWDTGAHAQDFTYLRRNTANNFQTDGLNLMLQNYLLTMHGYHAFASGYMGQSIFRNDSSHVPLVTACQGTPINVALVTGNGINPEGSADFGNGIPYAELASTPAVVTIVDKYANNSINYTITDGIATILAHNEQQIDNYDMSGSGTVFNPFADPNETALAKIVGGWEADERSYGDLYGFVPNGRLAIYRTGNGKYWDVIPEADRGSSIGTFNDNNSDGVLSAGDTIETGGYTYDVVAAVDSAVVEPTVTIKGTTYKLSVNSHLLVAQCPSGESGCSNFAIYVGSAQDDDSNTWYVNTSGGRDINEVYTVDGNDIYNYKSPADNASYYNFYAMKLAKDAGSDVIANTNVLAVSRDYNYTTTETFKKDAYWSTPDSDNINYNTFFQAKIESIYGEDQGGIANTLLNSFYVNSTSMLVMPAGDYLFYDATTYNYNLETPDATFENYAPLLYGSNLNHNFMTVVAVQHSVGTTSASSIAAYGDGINQDYGQIELSSWFENNNINGNIYSSRKCGTVTSAGGDGVDPWCFAAAGPTAEMATASAAGAVAAVKSAFNYMNNNQVFTLLALTADGPYLKTDTDGTVFTTATLVQHLKEMYDLPLEYNVTSTVSDTQYLDWFKEVFGYGLINIERAIKPGFAVYYYDGTIDNIVSSDGINKFWGKVTSNNSRASTVFSLTPRAAIKTSFYDIVESADGSLSLPRVWNTTLSMDGVSRHGLYMGDVLGDFNVDSANKRSRQIGNLQFDMAMSARAYNDSLNGLDNLRVAFVNEHYDINAQYQRYLTDGESRFDGRANGVLALVANTVSSGAKYKMGNFAFETRAFSGAITDENLLENDPVVASQFEPGRLGLANGIAVDTEYNTNSFGFNISVGNMRENKTVLGMYSDGILALNGGNTQYVDAVATYKPTDKIKMTMRATFANTDVDYESSLINNFSSLKSDAFAFGLDVSGFEFTAAMPLAVVDGRMGYSYAEFSVVENDGKYDVVMNNPHIEYVDLSAQKRELRFSGSYKQSIGDFTDAGIGFIHRVNPNNTDMFGDESILMFKIHHRIGI